MVGLPNVGTKVLIRPRPSRKAHANARPIDKMGGGRFLSEDGEVVKWDEWHLCQLRAGDILFPEIVEG